MSGAHLDRRLCYARLSPELFYSDGGFRAVDRRDIELLTEAAAASPRRRARLCFHQGAGDAQQEMLIVMHRSSYVRPHRHLHKVETLGIVEGACDAILFEGGGTVATVVGMSPASDDGAFFYRMPPGRFHTLILRSEWLVFVETTIGPFDPAETEAAAWAPPETDPDAGHAFLARCASHTDRPG